ncbi:hypothetical protein [Epilithonimonas zeae]|uniref:hypothetical protein n=1 Tax=Epilithonimonas zeae TaxID=1416779 RepID=UPI00200DA3C6|nr:hypothetical protein [Epilithonimonas zeae]UQB68106.1 hypothetical protein KI430_13865 [Epilithonimonas zeae]
MKQIIVTRKKNQDLSILKVLSIFRDRNLITSLEEIGYYMKMYENNDEVIVESNEEDLDDIVRNLTNEGVNFIIK